METFGGKIVGSPPESLEVRPTGEYVCEEECETPACDEDHCSEYRVLGDSYLVHAEDAVIEAQQAHLDAVQPEGHEQQYYELDLRL